jgi:hypothetical protein
VEIVGVFLVEETGAPILSLNHQIHSFHPCHLNLQVLCVVGFIQYVVLIFVWVFALLVYKLLSNFIDLLKHVYFVFDMSFKT